MKIVDCKGNNIRLDLFLEYKQFGNELGSLGIKM